MLSTVLMHKHNSITRVPVLSICIKSRSLLVPFLNFSSTSGSWAPSSNCRHFPCALDHLSFITILAFTSWVSLLTLLPHPFSHICQRSLVSVQNFLLPLVISPIAHEEAHANKNTDRAGDQLIVSLLHTFSSFQAPSLPQRGEEVKYSHSFQYWGVIAHLRLCIFFET